MKRFFTGMNLSSVIAITIVASIVAGLVSEIPTTPATEDVHALGPAEPPLHPAPLPPPDALRAVRTELGMADSSPEHQSVVREDTKATPTADVNVSEQVTIELHTGGPSLPWHWFLKLLMAFP